MASNAEKRTSRFGICVQIRRPSGADLLIKTDRAYDNWQYSEQRPNRKRSRSHGVGDDPNAKGRYSYRDQKRQRLVHMHPSTSSAVPSARTRDRYPPERQAI